MASPFEQFQQFPPSLAAALHNNGASLGASALPADGGASTDTGPHCGGCHIGSHAGSLCSNPGDGVGTMEEEELSRQLTLEVMLEFEGLSTQGSGGGGLQSPHSHRSSLRSSRKASGAYMDDTAGEEAVAGLNGDKEAVEEEEEEERLPSLYDQVGGGVAAKALVDEFYGQVLADPLLAFFFEGVDMSKQTRKFLLFVTYVLGGPDEYLQLNPEPWPQLYAVHERLINNCGLNEAHFDTIQQHFGDALEKLGVGPVQVGQALGIVETTRRVIFPLAKPTVAQGEGGQEAPRCPFSGETAVPQAAGHSKPSQSVEA